MEGDGSGSARGASARRAPNKGFARRPQRLLEGPYVAIPACGGEWEWEWEWVWVGMAIGMGVGVSMGMGTGIGVGNGYGYWYGCGYGCG